MDEQMRNHNTGLNVGTVCWFVAEAVLSHWQKGKWTTTLWIIAAFVAGRSGRFAELLKGLSQKDINNYALDMDLYLRGVISGGRMHDVSRSPYVLGIQRQETELGGFTNGRWRLQKERRKKDLAVAMSALAAASDGSLSPSSAQVDELLIFQT